MECQGTVQGDRNSVYFGCNGIIKLYPFIKSPKSLFLKREILLYVN